MTDPESDPDEFSLEQSLEDSLNLQGTNFALDNQTWKVLGETPKPGASGVLGYNSSGSGRTTGVEGVVDSSITSSTGVRGTATPGSGLTYGVRGVTNTAENLAAGVLGEATDTALGVYGRSSKHIGIGGLTDAGQKTGVVGANPANSNATGTGYGVRGYTDTVGDGSTGVLGRARVSSGLTYGVQGITSSHNADAAGVRGDATANSGAPAGVEGVSRAPDGTGVMGRSTNGSASFGMGVHGETDSTGLSDPLFGTFFTAGVYGNATATSGGVVATAGVWGTNNAASGIGHGIYGTTSSENLRAAGTSGKSFGRGAGVRAVSSSGMGLSVEGTSSASDNSPALFDHAAVVEDTESTFSSVLAVKSGNTGPTGDDNLVTFFEGGNLPIGSIEGDGSGGVNYTSGSADYAEFLPRLDAAEDIEPADVVGVFGGAITRRTAGADQAFVVSSHPIVTGNSPGQDPEDRRSHEKVAFVGQIPVKVRGTVETGDLIVPSGEADGTGRAVPADAWTPGDGPVVGRAWDATDVEAVDRVTVAVGLETGAELEATVDHHGERIAALDRANDRLRGALERRDERITDLASEVEALRAENERLRSTNEDLTDRLRGMADHLAGLDDRLASLERGGASTACADD